MADEKPDSHYTHGYGDSGDRFSYRTATVDADFFLPHLKPEMSVLDCGCGSGSITIGIAEVVASGQVVGIDIGQAPIEHARELARERKVSNVKFEVASIDAIPFENASFDAVFSNFVLEHLRSPADALKEMHRVMKPGGVIGLVGNDVDGRLLSPTDDPIVELFKLRERVWEHNGGNPRIGKHLRGMLHEAGFSRVRGMEKRYFSGTKEEIELMGNRIMIGNVSKALETAAELGWTDAEAKNRVADQWYSFAAKPDAYISTSQCQAIGWKE